jgi:CheY-like chemotaxis protein
MSKKILIVDDEQDTLSVLGKGLTAEGYLIIKADNGGDALVLATSERPDLIILDVLMPGMDGGEVARRLKGIPETEDIPVIFLTGMFPKREEEEEEEEGHTVAGHVLFDKPYDVLKLATAIRKLLQEKNRILLE